MSWSRAAALGGCAALALSVLLLPWYALDEYVPSGWQATWWARAALVLAVAAAVVLRLAPGATGAAAVLTSLALGAVAFRVALPPDFGFDFDGLDVPVERRAGSWTGLAAAALAAVGSLSARRGRRRADGAGGAPASP